MTWRAMSVWLSQMACYDVASNVSLAESKWHAMTWRAMPVWLSQMACYDVASNVSLAESNGML